MKKILTLLSALLLTFGSLSAQTTGENDDYFKPIARYFGRGDVSRLSAWIAPNIEISVISSFNNTSREHAIRILEDFFASYTPSSLQITHTASQPNLKYAVGTLSAGGENFSVTLFAAYSEKRGFLIQQIKIDRSTSIF